MLRPVWLQLRLFPFDESSIAALAWASGYSGVSDLERDGRTGREWINAIRDYLRFRSGDAWRRLSDPVHRIGHRREWSAAHENPF